jgi:hypothetical protein
MRKITLTLIFLAAIRYASADTIVTTRVFAGSPTGIVSVGAVSPIAAFAVSDQDPVRLESLRFLISETGSANPWTTAQNVSADIDTIQLFADDGTQIGPTVTPATCGGAIFGATSFDCSFTPLRFVFGPGSTRILTIQVGVSSGSDLTTIMGSLVPSAVTNAIQLNDGQDRLFLPTARLDANLLQVNGASTATPDAGTWELCSIGFGLFVLARFRMRRSA